MGVEAYAWKLVQVNHFYQNLAFTVLKMVKICILSFLTACTKMSATLSFLQYNQNYYRVLLHTYEGNLWYHFWNFENF